MAMSAKAILVDVLDVAPNTEIILAEGPPGTWTADTTVEKTCHDCRLQYDVPIQISYTPNFESWTEDVCTITMDGETEFGGTFGPESVGSVVSTVVEGDVQTRVGKVQPPLGHGYLSNSTITFTCTDMPLVTPPHSTTSSMTATPDTQISDGVSEIIIDIVLRDTNSVPVPDFAFDWDHTPTNGNLVFVPASGVTDENGAASTTLTCIAIASMTVFVGLADDQLGVEISWI